MNRDELEAFFAKADDVLTDWTPGVDAMRARPPGDGDVLPPLIDSYYDQQGLGPEQLRALAEIGRTAQRAMQAMSDAFAEFACRVRPMVEQAAARRGPALSFVVFDEAALWKGEDVRSRALRQRQQRNTGPVVRIGLDGFRR